MICTNFTDWKSGLFHYGVKGMKRGVHRAEMGVGNAPGLTSQSLYKKRLEKMAAQRKRVRKERNSTERRLATHLRERGSVDSANRNKMNRRIPSLSRP